MYFGGGEVCVCVFDVFVSEGMDALTMLSVSKRSRLNGVETSPK
jgi:hypothetical protein